MELKYLSWAAVVVCLLLNIFGTFWCFLMVIGLVAFLLGFLSIFYVHHSDVESYLAQNQLENPLEEPRFLGLNLDCDEKPNLSIVPNIKIQTESPVNNKGNKLKVQNVQDIRKKSLIDSGIELLFSKKQSKNVAKDNYSQDLKFRQDVFLDSRDSINVQHHQDDKKWKPFETIKIYTDKRKAAADNQNNHKDDIHLAEECSGATLERLYSDSAVLDEHGSPKKKSKAKLSGNKQIDHLLHTIIDYILRDYIDSWFSSLTDNKEFSEYRTRKCIEESVQNVCNRIKNTRWIPLMTTKLIEQVATHSRLYRLANQQINKINDAKESKQKNLSPQRRHKKDLHRRNKSDTDLNWYLGASSVQKNVANSKFYTDHVEEKVLIDPEVKLLNAFFNINDLYKDECLDEAALEKYLIHVMETVLYFTLPEEDFACVPLRTFLSALLANVVCKPVLEMLSDPDFINLQVARLFSKEPPPGEFFIKLIRQCNDLSELRACRQFITKQMDLKYKESSSNTELGSLKYTQKLIDLRLSYLQNNKSSETTKMDREKSLSNLPILTLDELLTKELALSYYLDYLSILNLQKYVIFYLTAQEWKVTSNRCMSDQQTNKHKSSREEVLRSFRDKAQNIYDEYLVQTSTNSLNIDQGLIEALNIKLRDTGLTPESSWFDSICKFVYEKLKNEDIFLNNFYQSSAYKKLLLELEVYGQTNEQIDLDSNLVNSNLNFNDTGSDTNSGDIPFDEVVGGGVGVGDAFDDGMPIIVVGDYEQNKTTKMETSIIGSTLDLAMLPMINTSNSTLDATNFRHSRSHSDCTGVLADITVGSFNKPNEIPKKDQTPVPSSVATHSPAEIQQQQKLFAKIINTAIHCEGQYAVYAIQVSIIEDNQQKSWHIYRRYSKFLELKKILVKKYPTLSRIPFPAKKAFQNTQRSVLEHRMLVLNEFLRTVCVRAEDSDEITEIMRDFMEPDTNDKKIHGGTVIRTIETLVNPFKSGMRTIKNMPDTFVGGIAKLLLGKGPMKEPSFLDVTPIHLEQSSDYPALTAALNLLDEVFDLQARSQWLRRGIINRLLGAPWVSHTANKKIIQSAKSLIDVDKIELLLVTILNSIWPDGVRKKRQILREDNTKLRTRMAAKIALFALLSDDLKHVVGSETTRYGLLNCFTMWQNKKLNLRLVLVLLNDILTTLYQTENMTKHVKDN